MNFENYTNNCLKTWCGKNRLERSIHGITGEAGEVAEKRKKLLRGDFEYDEYLRQIKKELGDVLYYISVCSYEHGLSLDDIAKENIRKLASRKDRGVINGSGDER